MNPDKFKNYRDVSRTVGADASFQFQFNCDCCDFVWRSPGKAYKAGRLQGLMATVAQWADFLGVSQAKKITNTAYRGARMTMGSGESKAMQEALQQAKAQAVRHFNQCQQCQFICCESCFDEGVGVCKKCTHKTASRGYQADHSAHQQSSSSGAVCSNCQAPSEGGRFCHECGFDMASTHKSCPTCGSVMPRAARFCTDCGHGF
jgi:Double zinc ribbon